MIEPDVLEKAYELGVEESPDEGKGNESKYREYAHFINTVDPKLRAMAGFTDSGPGTYRVGRHVTVSDGEGNTENMHVSYVYDAVSKAFSEGFRDGDVEEVSWVV